MLSDPVVIGAALIWLGLLFAAAVWGERHGHRFAGRWGTVYALSLAVHCTSWTFFGTVTQAARSGWPIPPTFIGGILLYAFGFGLLLKLVRLAREHHSTSLADLIATRLGRDSALAAAITLVAVLGMLPYIALQLKAVAMSYGLLTRASELNPPPWQDSALYVALAMALFAMLFGTRRASAAEHNQGMVLAIALESVLKLVAMLAIGAFVWFGVQVAPEAAARAAAEAGPRVTEGFLPLIVLGALAMFMLPHQFHVGIVECRDPAHLRTARWLFPLYLVLISLPILPLARAGEALLGPSGVPSDLYVLALPLAQGNHTMALVGFLGGLSAATGMVIIGTLAVALMVGNHWLAPVLVRRGWARDDGRDLRGAVLVQRRVVIIVVVLLAWLYSRAIGGSQALADIGAVSFSSLATVAPALAFAVWRPQTPPRAVLAGLVAGVLVWAWVLLVPAVFESRGAPPPWLLHGPLGLAWLAPDQMAGLTGWGRLARSIVLSLFASVLVTVLWATLRQPVGAPPANAMPAARLRALAHRFLPQERVCALLPAGVAGDVEAPRLAQVERELSAVLGAASARLLIDAARREDGSGLDTVATIVGEASQALRFNQRVLEAALENMSQGISVVDRELRLVAWNRRYAELFGFPDGLLQVGRPIADLARHALARHAPADAAAIDALVERRLAHMRAGSPHLTERRFPDGTVVEIRGNPMPGGGFVATFTDVTAFRRTEAELKTVAESLEQRVEERTRALAEASSEAQRANAAKSRLLAAVGHDLAQPLNAARLFTHALGQQPLEPPQAQAVGHIDGALGSAEALLAGITDISRLDAGGMNPRPRAFALDQVLEHLAAEFDVLARDKGLALDWVRCSAWTRSDPQLLRRVLQNFLGNAVRYTRSGRVLLGVRRRGGELVVEVHDTGPGIAEADQALIFEEFRRLGRGGQGMGLGLAIADRVARLLGHRIELRSRPGVGTVFGLRLPRVQAVDQPPVPAPGVVEPLLPGRVLVVDNDPAVLEGMRTLLEGWGLQVQVAADEAGAIGQRANHRPDLVVLDYHLDDGRTGLEVLAALQQVYGPMPALLLTADHGEAVRTQAAAVGCAVLHKPVRPLALKSMLTRLLGRRP